MSSVHKFALQKIFYTFSDKKERQNPGPSLNKKVTSHFFLPLQIYGPNLLFSSSVFGRKTSIQMKIMAGKIIELI